MEIALEELLKVNENELSIIGKEMLYSSIEYVRHNNGKAFIHCHVLEDLGIKIKS